MACIHSTKEQHTEILRFWLLHQRRPSLLSRLGRCGYGLGCSGCRSAYLGLRFRTCPSFEGDSSAQRNGASGTLGKRARQYRTTITICSWVFSFAFCLDGVLPSRVAWDKSQDSPRMISEGMRKTTHRRCV